MWSSEIRISVGAKRRLDFVAICDIKLFCFELSYSHLPRRCFTDSQFTPKSSFNHPAQLTLSFYELDVEIRNAECFTEHPCVHLAPLDRYTVVPELNKYLSQARIVCQVLLLDLSLNDGACVTSCDPTTHNRRGPHTRHTGAHVGQPEEAKCKVAGSEESEAEHVDFSLTVELGAGVHECADAGVRGEDVVFLCVRLVDSDDGSGEDVPVDYVAELGR